MIDINEIMDKIENRTYSMTLRQSVGGIFVVNFKKNGRNIKDFAYKGWYIDVFAELRMGEFIKNNIKIRVLGNVKREDVEKYYNWYYNCFPEAKDVCDKFQKLLVFSGE